MKRFKKALLPATLALALVIPQAAMAADTTDAVSTAVSTDRPVHAPFQQNGKAFGSSALSTDYIQQLVDTYTPESIGDWTTVLEKRESLKTEIKTVTGGLHNNNPFAGSGTQAELTDEQKAEREAQKAQLSALKAQLDAGTITKDEYLVQLKELGLASNMFGGSERSKTTTGPGTQEGQGTRNAQGQNDGGSRGGQKQAFGGARGQTGQQNNGEQAQGQSGFAGKGGSFGQNGLQGPRGGQHPDAPQASLNSTEADASESVTVDETTGADTELPVLSVQEQLYAAIQNEDSELIEALLPLLLEEYKTGNTSLQDKIDELAALAASADSVEEE